MIYLEGNAYFAKIFEHNRDMEGFEGAYVDCDGAYTIEVDLDDVEYQKLQDSGSKIVGRETEDGFHRVKFKRKHKVIRKDTGEIIPALSGPPQVVDADGNSWDSETLVGNHSRVRVAVSVEQDKKSKRIVYTRLEGVKVLELKEYTGGDAKPKLPF